MLKNLDMDWHVFSGWKDETNWHRTKGDADYLNTGAMGNRWKQSGIRGRQSDR